MVLYKTLGGDVAGTPVPSLCACMLSVVQYSQPVAAAADCLHWPPQRPRQEVCLARVIVAAFREMPAGNRWSGPGHSPLGTPAPLPAEFVRRATALGCARRAFRRWALIVTDEFQTEMTLERS